MLKGRRLSPTEEAELFPSNRAGLPAPGEMDPGLAWCESTREVDPDCEIALALSRKIRASMSRQGGDG